MSYKVLCKEWDNRDRWLKLRRKGLGASDSYVLLGDGISRSPHDVYISKVLGESITENEKMLAGKALEDSISEFITEKIIQDLELEEYSLWPCGELRQSTHEPYMMCTPDYVIELAGVKYLFEIKNSTQGDDFPEDQPCRRYWIQCQHQMYVSGESRMILGVLLWGYQRRWYWIERDDSFLETVLLPVCNRFWNRNVLCNIMPPPDDTESCAKALAKFYPDVEPEKIVELDEVWVELTEMYHDQSDQLKKVKSDQTRIANDVRSLIGSAERAKLPDGRAWTWKKGKKGRTLRAPKRRAHDEA